MGGENRWLMWFFHGVQVFIVFLSAGSLIGLFDMYESLGPLGKLSVGPVPVSSVTSTGIALAIDFATLVFGFAAVSTYENTREVRNLVVPILMMAIFASISSYVNYEMNSGITPSGLHYESILGFSNFVGNAMLIAFFPWINVLLTFAVPFISGKKRILTTEEQEEEKRRLTQEYELNQLKANLGAGNIANMLTGAIQVGKSAVAAVRASDTEEANADASGVGELSEEENPTGNPEIVSLATLIKIYDMGKSKASPKPGNDRSMRDWAANRRILAENTLPKPPNEPWLFDLVKIEAMSDPELAPRFKRGITVYRKRQAGKSQVNIVRPIQQSRAAEQSIFNEQLDLEPELAGVE